MQSVNVAKSAEWDMQSVSVIMRAKWQCKCELAACSRRAYMNQLDLSIVYARFSSMMIGKLYIRELLSVGCSGGVGYSAA